MGKVARAPKSGAAALALSPLPWPERRGKGARWPAGTQSTQSPPGKGMGSPETLEFRVPTRDRGGEIEERGDGRVLGSNPDILGPRH